MKAAVTTLLAAKQPTAWDELGRLTSFVRLQTEPEDRFSAEGVPHSSRNLSPPQVTS